MGQGTLVTDANTGENFCGKCGYVLTDNKWMNLDQNGDLFLKKNTKIEAELVFQHHLAMHDMGLATIINPINRDATGKPLSASMKSTIERLRTWDSRSQVHEPIDRNFRQAFSELDRLKDKLSSW